MSVWLPTGKKHAMAQIDLTSAPYTDHVRYLSYTVPPERDQVEVGTLLRRSLGLSAGLIKRVKWLTDGITLDGQRATTRTRAGAGQCLRIRLSDNVRSSDIPSSPGALDLLYEDEDLLVVNKAPGVAVHPGIGHWEHTLGCFLLYYYDAKGIPADFHPVHRLDKGTSGAMVVAKHSYAQELLRQALHSNAFDREYFAVCDGIPSPMQDTITFPLAHSGTSVIRQEIRPDGLPAHTDYEVLSHTACRSLVRLHLKTGRTHQIRVHMAAIGCPLTGDFLYGTENPDLIRRPALHSSKLSFLHPLSKKQLTFTVPLPKDMEALLTIS